MKTGSGCYRSHTHCFCIIHTRSIKNVTLLQSYFLHEYRLRCHTCREYFSSIARIPLSHTHPDVHAHAHTLSHTYIYTYIHTYIHTYTHAYMHTCTHAHMHTCTHAHMHIPISVATFYIVRTKLNQPRILAKMRLGEKITVYNVQRNPLRRTHPSTHPKRLSHSDTFKNLSI